MTAIATIRDALSKCGSALSRAELLDTTNLDGASLDKNLYTAKKRGELTASVEDGKPVYALNPDYVPPRIGRRPAPKSAPALTPTSPPGRQARPAPGPPPKISAAQAKPPAASAAAATPAAVATPAPSSQPATPLPAQTERALLLNHLRTACALSDLALERALHLSTRASVMRQLAQASRHLHSATLALLGGDL